MIIQCYWYTYKYFLYEKELALKELTMFFNPLRITEYKEYVEIEVSEFTEEHKLLATRLTYFKLLRYEDCNEIIPIQSKLEDTQVTTINRQVTRYAAHGLHEYKGKFNPQIVRSIINILGLNENSKVIDPFSGSGTTILECSIQNIDALGIDINPLAVLMGNSKQKAMTISTSEIANDLVNIVNGFNKRRNNYEVKDKTSERAKYLEKWFPLEHFKDIELLRDLIMNKTHNTQDIFSVLVSNHIREYSLQEPSDLRIRKRTSPLPDAPIIEVFEKSVLLFIDKIKSSQKIISDDFKVNKAKLCDSREFDLGEVLNLSENYFDAGITSPPYATALPYIDTQRLSLVWLDLIPPNEINLLESELIGSREFKKVLKKEWTQKFINNESELEPYLYDYCMKLQNALSDKDGFRRQATPVLLYRYLVDMKLMFANLLPYFKVGGKYALVVGHNETTLGGTKFNINTPQLLVEVAKSSGWKHSESIELQTYQRYGLHHKNSVKYETLIIFSKK